LNWVDLKDDELLEWKICDLKLTLQGAELEIYVNMLYNELALQGIELRPECYLADEWFVPDGDTVIGIPFYLAHPRLRKLEEKTMLDVEGDSPESCMQLLRHEAGHAVYYAYRLDKKKKVREIFGIPSHEETPTTYRPRPYSRGYVRHLDYWYAQSSPEEDFAETFAVWLTPKNDWKRRYQGWKALGKLNFVDQLMKSLRHRSPAIMTKDHPYAASRLRLKLKTYYQRKRKLYEEDYPDFYDSHLKKLFSVDQSGEDGESAYQFMKRYRRVIVDKISRWTGEKKYTVNSLVHDLMKRCQQLSLKRNQGENETLMEVTSYLTSMVSNYLFTGTFKRSV